MSKQRIRTVSTLIVLAVIASLYSKQSSASDESYVPLGNVAVVVDVATSEDNSIRFSWRDSNNNITSIDDFRGNVILINFWATWCVPCRREIPYLIEINNELSNDSFTLIGISVDNASDIEKVNMFIDEQNINYPNILDDGRLARQFGDIRAIPTTLILDRNGQVRETIIGIRTKEQFMEKIMQYL